MTAFLRTARIIAAGIFLQSLFFKFTAHPESVMIFSSLGLEPRGRIGIGVIELIAALLLLFGRRKSRYGGLLGTIVMLGAIHAHLTTLGINTLFAMAIVTLGSCLTVMRLQRHDLQQTLRQPRFWTQLVITILAGVMYFMNYLATTGALGVSMMQLDELFPFPYMPPGRTFGIARGSIYLLLGGFVARGRTTHGQASKLYQYLLPRFVVTAIFNMLRLRLTSRDAFALSVAIMMLLWVTLGQMLHAIAKTPGLTSRDYRTIKFPRGVYYGWISLAAGMIALSQLVYLSAPLLAVTRERTRAILLLGILIAGISFRKRRNRGQLLISILAFVGILSAVFAYF